MVDIYKAYSRGLMTSPRENERKSPVELRSSVSGKVLAFRSVRFPAQEVTLCTAYTFSNPSDGNANGTQITPARNSTVQHDRYSVYSQRCCFSMLKNRWTVCFNLAWSSGFVESSLYFNGTMLAPRDNAVAVGSSSRLGALRFFAYPADASRPSYDVAAGE